MADNLEIARLAEPLIGQPRQIIDNRLLSEARHLLALGLPERAAIYVEAAKRAGREDERLSQQVRAAVDETIPHRKQALAEMRAIRDEADLFDLDRASMRVVHRVAGTNEERIRDANGYTMAAYRAGVELGAGLPTGSEASDAGATTPDVP